MESRKTAYTYRLCFWYWQTIFHMHGTRLDSDHEIQFRTARGVIHPKRYICSERCAPMPYRPGALPAMVYSGLAGVLYKYPTIPARARYTQHVCQRIGRPLCTSAGRCTTLIVKYYTKFSAPSRRQKRSSWGHYHFSNNYLCVTCYICCLLPVYCKSNAFARSIQYLTLMIVC